MKEKRKNYKSDKPCLVCGENRENMVCMHHIKTRKSGGSDESFNLMPLCQKHHNEIHSSGTYSFVTKYRLQEWMMSNGWIDIGEKFIHRIQ